MAADTRFILTTPDGFPLAVDRFDPPSAVKATCIIINATGVLAQFYHPFARHLAANGVATCTFDYRFSGKSFPPHLLERLQSVEPASSEFDDLYYEAICECPEDQGLMDSWCRRDLAAVVLFMRKTWPSQPLTLLGNSLGAHLASLLEEETLFPPSSSSSSSSAPTPPVRILNVCGGNAYWENNPSGETAKIVFDRMIRDPLETDRVFRSSALGLGYDLPYAAGVDWLKWFYHPLFSLQDPSDEKRGRKLGQRLEKYLYVGFEDDATICRLMQTQHLNLFSHTRENFHSLWIDPPKCRPAWPSMGHVTSFLPTNRHRNKAPTSSQEGNLIGSEETSEDRSGGRATEAYEPSSLDQDEQQVEKPTLTREETIFRLYLDYILHGNIWTQAPGIQHKVWTVADERDRDQLRRGWEKAMELQKNKERAEMDEAVQSESEDRHMVEKAKL